MSETRPTLLFVHGWATDSAVWKYQTEFFRGLGFKCVCADLPGHGGAGHAWDVEDLSPAASEVARCIAQIDNDIIAVGWSLGAQALIAAAAAQGERCGVRGLVLVGATPLFVKTEDFPWAQSRSLVRRMLIDVIKDPARTLHRFRARTFTHYEFESEGAKWFLDLYKALPKDFIIDGVANALRSLMRTDLRFALGHIHVPCLVVHGAEDAVCPLGAARFISDKIPGAQFKLFEGIGHAPFITNPDAFNERVLEFIQGLRG